MAAGDDAHLRRQAGRLRRGADRAAGDRQLARRRRPRRRLRGLGRPRLRPRPGRRRGARRHARALRAHRRRGQERRLPRARHARLERLLRRARRDGRLRAPRRRPRPEGGHRRLGRPRARPRALAGRGDAARVPRARGQPALDRLDDPPRLQGRLRAVGHRRLPVRLRRHHRRGRGLDVRDADREVRPRRGRRRVHAPLEPVGAAGDRRAAARGGRPRAVGGARGARRSRRCAAPTWRPRASWRRRRRERAVFPFTAIVGQEALGEALLVCAVDPRIGGVLVRGERGTAKSTAVRALAPLLADVEVVAGCRFNADPAERRRLPRRPARRRRGRAPAGGAGRAAGGRDRRPPGRLARPRPRAARGVAAFEPGLLAGRPPRDPVRRRGQPAARPPRRRRCSTPPPWAAPTSSARRSASRTRRASCSWGR